MTTMTSEREAFEAWYIREHTPPDSPPITMPRNVIGEYGVPMRDISWIAWQARAHLAQPAQAVDVGAIREVIADLREWGETDMQLAMRAATLTRAISGEKAGPVGDGLPDENWFADQICDLRNRWGEHEPSWLETDDNHPDDWMAKELRKRLLALPASPTPDKEGE